MQYKGKELEEILPENWDGRSREMLVWWNRSPAPSQLTVIGYDPVENGWVDSESLTHWTHCAEIPEDKSEKKLRRMTYKELDNWLEQGKGLVKIADHIKNTITYDCEDRNHEVSSYYKICGYNEDAWHEPLIEE